MTSPIAYISTNQGVTIVNGGKTLMVANDHELYGEIIASLSSERWEYAAELIDQAEQMRKATASFTGTGVKFDGHQVTFNGKALTGALVTKILHTHANHLSTAPLINFLTKLLENPSKRAVDELYLFLESGHIAIHPDGDFLAYKVVNADYKDCHSQTFDNSVGQVHTMPRNEVDDERDRTCSYGFHFCSLDYSRNAFWTRGRRMMIVKINPKDVVSIPSDYANTKGRTCAYTVFAEQDTSEWEDRSDVKEWTDKHFYDDDEYVDEDGDYENDDYDLYYDDDEDDEVCPW